MLYRLGGAGGHAAEGATAAAEAGSRRDGGDILLGLDGGATGHGDVQNGSRQDPARREVDAGLSVRADVGDRSAAALLDELYQEGGVEQGHL